MSWLSGVVRKSISEAEGDYRWYGGMIDDNVGQLADVLVIVVDDWDEVFPQKVIWEGNDE